MLFDLRSRGRRHTVRVIYLFLALVMVAGLVLVGVGTGTSGGGLLNAFTNNGNGGSGQGQVLSQQTKAAIKATEKNPQSATAWASLVTARFSEAESGSNYNSTTGVFSKAGKEQLQLAADAWQKYLTVSNNKPSFEAASLAARTYQNLGQWKNASSAWEFAAGTQASNSATARGPLMCMAFSAYAAGNTSTGDLAAAKAVALTPKLQRLTTQSTFKSAKTSATTAQGYLLQNC